ncbi:MAG: transposase [Lentisphaerae bacterium]|nr:transposase [Lentisphaerota bacterium]
MEIIYPNYMKPEDYFKNPLCVSHKQYEALRYFFNNNMKAEETAEKFGYKLSAFYSLIRDFRKHLKEDCPEDLFFKASRKGRGLKKNTDELVSLIVNLRKKNFSVPEIKSVLDAQEYRVSERYIYLKLRAEGFARLPRRDKKTRTDSRLPRIEAPKSTKMTFANESFSTGSAGLSCFLPYVLKYGLHTVIEESLYPGTKSINRLSSVLSFLSLKLSNVRRYSTDDLWCMDRGGGLFAGLNVLPKTAWFSSYSHRVTRNMNLAFLKDLHRVWKENDLLEDTANLDFTTIPYWGDDDHLENNWSGKRRHSLASMLAVLAHYPDSGIIDYGDTNVMHKNQNAVILEFLDFYKAGNPHGGSLKYLVFDSKFTNYTNLRKLDEENIKFITIRRRGKNIVERINNMSNSEKKKIKVVCAGNKYRTLYVCEEKVNLNGYGKKIRQIAITGHGRVKPALVITNDFDLETEDVVRKYARRALVEKTISEQAEFFHLNRVSSSVVIKVDFDLTMTILAHNLYRLLATDLERYSESADVSIYEKFILNSGEVEITDEVINVKLKKKRNLPTLLAAMQQYSDFTYSFLKNKKLIFSGMTIS